MLWSFRKVKYFMLGCPNLKVSMHLKLLLGILGDEMITDMDYSYLREMKEKICLLPANYDILKKHWLVA